MFGETEVNLSYLLIAAIFPLCSLPIHAEKNSSQRRKFIKKHKNISILWWLEIWAVLLAGNVFGMHVYSLILDVQLIY